MPLILSTLIPGVATTKTTLRLTLRLSDPHVLAASNAAVRFAGFTGHRCNREKLSCQAGLGLSFSLKKKKSARTYRTS